jgi:Sulfatase
MEDMTDKAIKWVRQQKTLLGDKPFFVYFAPGATHAPHHVPKEWADRYRGRFDQGWDRLREETIERQKALGVIPADAELTRRHDEIPPWDDMPEALKPVLIRQMEVYAGAPHRHGQAVASGADRSERVADALADRKGGARTDGSGPLGRRGRRGEALLPVSRSRGGRGCGRRPRRSRPSRRPRWRRSRR